MGIAGSAGALGALQTFFTELPAETGMAFVVVTHLSPEYESHIASLLQPHTKMTVTQVTERVPVQADHVYVIPPNHNILVSDSHVDVAEFTEPRSKRAPIDFFFRTLARSHGDAVAIIVSGGGTDGSVGAKEIKEEGGLLMVQDPEEAEYASMPNAAIATGLVDVVLPTRELARRLMLYRAGIPRLAAEVDGADSREWAYVEGILTQVQRRTKHDFSHYKRSKVLRRIRRRMLLTGSASMEAYLDYIRKQPAESFALLNDLLIGVTNFFRDHESWETLAREALPAIFKGKELADEVRVWSVGCATGEEAYSLAMLLQEAAYARDEDRTIRVFASDIDEDALARSREGLYPSAIEADVSPERLERFFIRKGDHYQVRRELRDMVLFTPHSVVRDPPFSHLDLIVCRNLLIYLQRDIQLYALDIFHYALNPGGYLFLGSSEAVTGKEPFFKTVDKTHRLFQTLPWRPEQSPALPVVLRTPRTAFKEAGGLGRLLAPHLPPSAAVLEEQHRQSLESFGPPSVLVGVDSRVLHISETAGRYLQLPKGPISSDLIKLARPELQAELRAVLFQAFERGRGMVSSPIVMDLDGQRREVVVAAYPREYGAPGQEADRQALVVFLEDEVRTPEPATEEAGVPPAEGSLARMAQLQAEVVRLRDQLQATNEEYEGSSEEMKAANEELQSMNEEYHLTTEELETSKEELEAVNEELQTVNNELKVKLDEVSRAHRDLEGVMGATEIATLFLGRDLHIQRYTPAVKEFFRILKTDIGRPISDLIYRLANYHSLVEDARQALDTLSPVEREIADEQGRWYLIRLRPYRTMDDHIEGVVITFVDVTHVTETDLSLVQMADTLEARVQERTKELEARSRRSERASKMFSTLFHANPIPTSLTRVEDGLFLDVNEAYLEFFGRRREDILGHTAAELGLPFQGHERAKLLKRLQKEGGITDLEMEIVRAPGDVRTVVASLQQVPLEGGSTVISTFSDITDRVRAEKQVRALAADLTAAEQTARHRISQVLHDDLQQRLFSIRVQLSFLRQALEEGDRQAMESDEESLDSALSEAIETTRRLSIDLSPVILQGATLADALAWLKEEVKQRYGLEMAFTADEPLPDMPEHMRVVLYNTLRELLFNIVKHSDVLEANLLVEQMGRGMRLTLTDHGKGFDAEKIMADPKQAHGLLELRNRLSLLGCQLKVISHPGDGTTVTIEVPV